MIELFELGENYTVVLNKAGIYTVPEFKLLLNRDKGSPGDVAGRFKKKAIRELTYIYHMYDFRSPFENYKEEDRIKEVEEMTQITQADVDKDEELQQAIARYKQMVDNCSIMLRGLRIMKRSTDKMWDSFDIKEIYTIEEVKAIQASMTAMPKTMESLKRLEEMVRQEIDGDTGMRGDAEKGHEEDPEFD